MGLCRNPTTAARADAAGTHPERRRVEDVEHLILGAGPAGLRAAQVLAEAGREVLVLEKHAEIGPKTCAGGLTAEDHARARGRWACPRDAALRRVGHVAFAGGRAVALDADATVVHTIARRDLGRLQLAWARAAGAEVRAGVAATAIDLAAAHRDRGRPPRSAGGTSSAPTAPTRPSAARSASRPRASTSPPSTTCRASGSSRSASSAIPARSPTATSGSSPTPAYTSLGAVAPKHLVAPAALRRYLDARLDGWASARDGVPFEGATLEVAYHGCHFPGGVHLAGDAAGVVSSLTAEGIYAALVTGEEVARHDPRAGRAGAQDGAAGSGPSGGTTVWRAGSPARAPRAWTLGTLARVAGAPALRRPLASWFLRP